MKTLGLVWAHESTRVEEAWSYFDAEPAELIALGKRDLFAGAFGRDAVGISHVADGDAWDWSSRPFTPAALLVDDTPPAAEPASLAPSPEEIERVEWWRFTCAFGTGTKAGVELRRCLARDATEANSAANAIGEAIFHQSTLYSVTAPAIRAILALLSIRELACRRELAEWLLVIAENVAEPQPEEPEDVLRARLLRTLTEALVPDWLRDSLLARGLSYPRDCRACQRVIIEEQARLARLARDGLVEVGLERALVEVARRNRDLPPA